jgi:hypothetical protein
MNFEQLSTIFKYNVILLKLQSTFFIKVVIKLVKHGYFAKVLNLKCTKKETKIHTTP